MTYRLAVDLGTAYAAAAVANGLPPTVVGLGNRAMQVPSVLLVGVDGAMVFGEAAERRGVTEPARVVREFKRRLGDPVPILVAGAAFSPETLMARQLCWIVARAATRQGELPSEVVLTIRRNGVLTSW